MGDATSERGDEPDDVFEQFKRNRKASFRFKARDDICLLRLVLKYQPWSAGHGEMGSTWEKVAQGLNGFVSHLEMHGTLPSDKIDLVKMDPAKVATFVDAKACTRRFNTLLEAYMKNSMESVRAVCVNNEFDERQNLLRQAKAKFDEMLKTKTARVNARVRRFTNADDHSDTESTSAGEDKSRRKRSRHGDDDDDDDGNDDGDERQFSRGRRHSEFEQLARVLGKYYEKKMHLSLALKERELELQAKQLALDEARLEMEKKERESHIAAMNAQTLLLGKLTEQLTRYGNQQYGGQVTAHPPQEPTHNA
ncbi:TPA: hypothetical protein N0F65_004911 [Lagenidium giganteum]|uniref:Uncharacterized protein n=1 Tax=Lagenidium giganteum TaxID=4803 RepID=A0AAV2Z170_9STRA|nr:TPA: hypothetical protein N0F65_004911 [Lagenidium giganteum]